MADVWANFMACHPRVTCHIAGCCNLTNSVSWSQNCVSYCRVLPPGEFNGMSSQRHVSHCRVLPLGEFTVMIPKPHATLQGVIIPSAILDIVFRRILFIVVFLKCSWTLTSGGFRIVSDTLVLCWKTFQNCILYLRLTYVYNKKLGVLSDTSENCRNVIVNTWS